jgi:hypothetical protein
VIFDAIHDSVATKQDLLRPEAALKTDIAAIKADLEVVGHQLITRFGGLMVVLTGLLFAALHYWPPAGHG